LATASFADITTEPLGSAGDVDKRCAGCNTGAVDLGLVFDDQALIGPDLGYGVSSVVRPSWHADVVPPFQVSWKSVPFTS
jgi:hypothetical protein